LQALTRHSSFVLEGAEQSAPFVSVGPLREVAFAGTFPLVGGEVAPAAVSDDDRPGAEAHLPLPRGAAKIHVIEVKVEDGVEVDSIAPKDRTPRGQQDAIEKLAGEA